MAALSLHAHLGIFWIQGLFTFCFLIFLLYRARFLVLTTWLFICEAHLAIALFFVAFVHDKNCQYENVYLLCNKLNKEVKRKSALIVILQRNFILKAGAMQNGIDFQSRNNFF